MLQITNLIAVTVGVTCAFDAKKKLTCSILSELNYYAKSTKKNFKFSDCTPRLSALLIEMLSFLVHAENNYKYEFSELSRHLPALLIEKFNRPQRN
jgi:hypothetical protein